jgi:hypothetical protein
MGRISYVTCMSNGIRCSRWLSYSDKSDYPHAFQARLLVGRVILWVACLYITKSAGNRFFPNSDIVDRDILHCSDISRLLHPTPQLMGILYIKG